MSDIPAFPYRLLWEERELRSVANLTRRDGDEFFDVVAKASVVTQTVRYPLTHANKALSDLRTGRLQGAACSCRTHPNQHEPPRVALAEIAQWFCLNLASVYKFGFLAKPDFGYPKS